MSISSNAQGFKKKIELKEGLTNNIKYKALNIGALLQVYGEKSAAHLIGDMYLKLDNNGEFITEFYIDNDKATKEYYTKIYGNYFLTFVIENNIKYLIIEQALFGKAFALSSNGSSSIGNKDDLVEIEITNYVHEWGSDGLPQDGKSNYFDDVHYTLKVKVKNDVKSFSFYSSEVKDDFVMDLGEYSIQILSDLFKDSSSLIEMVITKKEGK